MYALRARSHEALFPVFQCLLMYSFTYSAIITRIIFRHKGRETASLRRITKAPIHK